MISVKYLVIILLIIFLIIIIYKLNSKIEKLDIEQEMESKTASVSASTSLTTTIIQDYLNVNKGKKSEIVIEVMNPPIFEPNFMFDTEDKVRNNIEKLFNLYLDLINTNRINNKLNEYLVNKGDLNNISMQSIFTTKNLNLNSFSNKIYSLITNIILSVSKYINEDKYHLFALFNLIKIKLADTNNQFNYNYYKDLHRFVFVPKNMPNFVINSETLNNPNDIEEEMVNQKNELGEVIGSFARQKNKTRVNNIYECYDDKHKSNICQFSLEAIIVDKINSLAEKGKKHIKYQSTPIDTNTDNNVARARLISDEEMYYENEYINYIRSEFGNNLDKIILLCELNIVRELILAYNDALSTNNDYLINYNNIKNTDNFKNLENEISNVLDSIQIYEEKNIKYNLDIKSIINDSS